MEEVSFHTYYLEMWNSFCYDGVMFQNINIKITHENGFFIFIRMFFKNVKEKTSLNSITSIQGCLYMHPMIVFFFLFVYYLNKDRFKFFFFVDFEVIS